MDDDPRSRDVFRNHVIYMQNTLWNRYGVTRTARRLRSTVETVDNILYGRWSERKAQIVAAMENEVRIALDAIAQERRIRGEA